MELNKLTEIAQEKLTRTRHELLEVVVFILKFTTQLAVILTGYIRPKGRGFTAILIKATY